MGFLKRLGQHPPLGDIPVFALPGKFLGLPDLGQHCDGLLPQGAGVARVDAQPHLFVGVGAAGAELDPPVGQLVHQSHPLRHPYRMVVGQDADAVADTDVFGDAAQRAKDGVLAGRAGEPGKEVVFHEPDIVETHLVGQFTLGQGFLVKRVPVNSGALVGTLGLEQQAELHRAASFAVVGVGELRGHYSTAGKAMGAGLPSPIPGQRCGLVQNFRQNRKLAAGQFLIKDLLAGAGVIGAVDVNVRVIVPVVVFQYQVPTGYPGNIVVTDAPDLEDVAPVAGCQHRINLKDYAAPAIAHSRNGDARSPS